MSRILLSTMLAYLPCEIFAAPLTFTNVELNSASAITKSGMTLTPSVSNGGSIGPTNPEFPYSALWLGREASATNGSYTFNFSRPVTSIDLTFNALTYNTNFNPPIFEKIYGFTSETGSLASPISIDFLSASDASYSGGTISTTGLNGAGVIHYQSATPFTSFGFSHTKSFQFKGDGFLVSKIVVDPLPKVYGIFLGTNDSVIQGQTDAAALKGAFEALVPGFDGVLLKGNNSLAGSGITNAAVKAAIDQVAAKIQPGDKFIFYSESHGNSLPSGDETTLSAGDEYLVLGDQLTDDLLTSYLKGLGDSVDKWVLLEACYAGGFWGNESSTDEGDLEKLHNIGMIAASTEDKLGYLDGTSKRGLFTGALLDGLEVLANGYARADKNKNHEITFDELKSWVLEYRPNSVAVYELERGDLVQRAAEATHKQPTRDIEEFGDQPQRGPLLKLPSMSAGIALLADRVELVENLRRDETHELGAAQKVEQIGPLRLDQARVRVDPQDQLLGESAQLHGRSRWVGVRVALGKRRQVGERRRHRAQKLKVHASHRILSHAAAYATAVPLSFDPVLAQPVRQRLMALEPKEARRFALVARGLGQASTQVGGGNLGRQILEREPISQPTREHVLIQRN